MLTRNRSSSRDQLPCPTRSSLKSRVLSPLPPAGAAADATLQEGLRGASGRTHIPGELPACPAAAGDAGGWMVTSGTGAALVQGSLIESQHHGVSIFFLTQK